MERWGCREAGTACPESSGKQLKEPKCLFRYSSSKSVPWQGTARYFAPPGAKARGGDGGGVEGVVVAVLKKMF